MFEQDYILRLTKQLASLIARVLGLRRKGADDEALVAIEGAYGELFGLPEGLVDVMAPAELARLVGTREKAAMLAELLEAEAEIIAGRGDPLLAERKRTTARGLRDAFPEA